MEKDKESALDFYLNSSSDLIEKYESFTKIITNSAQCKKCQDVIVSNHRHDYVSCSCRAISVDGGKSYLKRSAVDFSHLIEKSSIRFYTIHEIMVEIKNCETQSGFGGDYYIKKKKLAEEFLQDSKAYYAIKEKDDIVSQLTQSLEIKRNAPKV